MDGMMGLTPSDVALITGNNGRNNNNGDGFGNGNGAWWIVLFLIFALGGWGRNGFGNNGGNGSGSGAMDNYVLASDFATLQRQLDSGFAGIERRTDAINNGLCDGFYAQAQLINGVNQNIAGTTASIQQTLCQGFNGVNQAITTNGYETRLGVQGLTSQLANCCCDIRQQISDCCCTTQRGLDGINYNMAMNTNGIQQTLCNNTRDIIENQNANYRALHDEIVANRIEDKNAQITAQQNEINALRLSASQQAQNAYLTSYMERLNPNRCPEPAYIVPNPNCCYNYTVSQNTCGCNCGNY